MPIPRSWPIARAVDDRPMLLLSNEQYIARFGWRARWYHVRDALKDGDRRRAVRYLLLRSKSVRQPDE